MNNEKEQFYLTFLVIVLTTYSCLFFIEKNITKQNNLFFLLFPFVFILSIILGFCWWTQEKKFSFKYLFNKAKDIIKTKYIERNKKYDRINKRRK